MVDPLVFHDLDVALEIVDDRSKMRRACEENVRDCLHVSVDDLIDTIDAWSFLVPVQREAVLDRIDAKMPGNTTEAKDWEVRITTEWLDMTYHTFEQEYVQVVLIRTLGADVMQR